jgi:hypothetical protein
MTIYEYIEFSELITQQMQESKSISHHVTRRIFACPFMDVPVSCDFLGFCSSVV